MSTIALSPNGHAEVVDGIVADPIAEAEAQMRSALADRANDLREMLTLASNRRMDLERLLASAKAHERRLAKAIQALEGEHEAPKPEPAKAPARTPGRKDPGWSVSPERVATIRAHLLRYTRELNPTNEPVTKTVFARELKDRYNDGVSSDTISQAFEALRAAEVIRKCGTTRGGGQLYKLMPSALAEATTEA